MFEFKPDYEISNQLFLGDSMPVAWPNLGPDMLGALYGCPLFFGDYGTSWSEPALAEWEQAQGLYLNLSGVPSAEAAQSMLRALERWCVKQ